jgi:hypothetical protein
MAHEISMMCRHPGLRRAMEGVIMLTKDGNRFLPPFVAKLDRSAVGRADGEGLPDP